MRQGIWLDRGGRKREKRKGEGGGRGGKTGEVWGELTSARSTISLRPEATALISRSIRTFHASLKVFEVVSVGRPVRGRGRPREAVGRGAGLRASVSKGML